MASGSAPPTEYGASWNVLSSGRELPVHATCTTEGRTFTVGSGASNQVVYKLRYGYSGGAWRPVTLIGTYVQGSTDWLSGRGTYTANSRITGNPFYWVGYICQWTGAEWKCGCRDAACATNYWQLQASADPFASGTTGGTTGGATGGATGGTTGGTTGGGTTGGGSLPTPQRTVNVSSNSQLSAALSSAQPGDHIVLADGSYGGSTITKSGTGAKPIVIRSANLHGAKIGGDIRIEGAYVAVVGLHVGANTVFVVGAHDRVTRNYFENSGYAAIAVGRGSTQAEIDHNEIIGGPAPSETAMADAIFIKTVCNAVDGHHVHHNYIHDVIAGGRADAMSAGFGNGCYGESLIEYNLVERWGGGKYCRCTTREGTTSGNSTPA